MMKSTILVPLDGSPLSEHALPYAQRLTDATSARLILCRALAQSALQHGEAERAYEEARTYLERVADHVTTEGRLVETAILESEPAAEILEHVRAAQVDLLVMATHGRSGLGRWLYGSVADEILRHATIPVVLVPPGATSPWPADRAPRIIVPLDGSELGEAALGPALELGVRLGAEIVLLQVVPFPPYSLYGDGSAYLPAFDGEAELAEARGYLGHVAERLPSTIAQVRVVAELGQPAVTIAEQAAKNESDLIAMATHGRGGLARLVLGSVATGTLQRTRVPLLLVRPAALDAATAQAAGET